MGGFSWKAVSNVKKVHRWVIGETKKTINHMTYRLLILPAFVCRLLRTGQHSSRVRRRPPEKPPSRQVEQKREEQKNDPPNPSGRFLFKAEGLGIADHHEAGPEIGSGPDVFTGLQVIEFSPA